MHAEHNERNDGDAPMIDACKGRRWIDPECTELDIPGVTQLAAGGPAPDFITSFS